jgi:hypothetical protein
MHTALWTLAAVSLFGAFVAGARPKHVSVEAEDERPARAEVQAAA